MQLALAAGMLSPGLLIPSHMSVSRASSPTMTATVTGSKKVFADPVGDEDGVQSEAGIRRGVGPDRARFDPLLGDAVAAEVAPESIGARTRTGLSLDRTVDFEAYDALIVSADELQERLIARGHRTARARLEEGDVGDDHAA